MMTNQSGTSRRLEKGLAFVLIGAVAAVAVAAMLMKGGGKLEATIPAGTTIVAALEQTVSTERHSVGDPVSLEAVEPIRVDETTVIPAGAVIHGEVTHAEGGGRIAGAPELTLRFTELELDGETFRIEAAPFRVRGKSDAAESAAQIAGGVVAGGIVGGVVGGGDNVVKGAAAGAIIGTGVAVATKGDHIVLPAGQKLRIRLSAPATVAYEPASEV